MEGGSCFTSGTRRVGLLTNSVPSHECGKIGLLLRQTEHIHIGMFMPTAQV